MGEFKMEELVDKKTEVIDQSHYDYCEPSCVSLRLNDFGIGPDRKLYQQVCSLGDSMTEEADCGTNYRILGQWKDISRVNMTDFIPIVTTDTPITLSLKRTGTMND